MYVNFGQPISAREYFGMNLNRFEHAQLPVHVQQLSKRELDLVNKLGKHVSVTFLSGGCALSECTTGKCDLLHDSCVKFISRWLSE